MLVSRRSFLLSSAAFTAAAALPADNNSALVGSQLFGWGQYYEREHKVLSEHWDEVFSALRDAGYDYAEGTLNASVPEENGRLADRMKRRGLKPVTIYTGGRLHEREPAERTITALLRAAAICAQAGYQIINCNPDPINRAKTDAELKVQAESLNTLGRELQQLGLKLAVHNHTPEMQNGAREFRNNLTATDSKHVGFCYDVNWVFRGGLKPEETLKEFGSRIFSWHLRQSRDGIWTEDLTYGEIDYAWVAKYAREHNLPQIYTIELALEDGTKVTRDAVENHRRSRDYVRRVMGV
jgi:inosose dehydratase